MSDFKLIPLVKDYYTITRQYKEGESYVFEVDLNEKCAVYQGHFPEEPIAPGVCNIQLIKECAEIAIQQKLQLQVLQRCRFLKLIIPQENKSFMIKINVGFSEEKCMVFAQVIAEQEIYLDLKGIFLVCK